MIGSIGACTGGAVGGAIAPREHTAAGAMGELVCDPDDHARVEPLTVDWSSDDRADLEIGMREGLVVVAFDCDEFRVLDQCRVEGGYAYAGVSRKQEVVQITGAGELHANLPVGKAELAAVIERGATIDIAMVSVGKLRTSATGVSAEQLEGDCAGATHIVRSALVGAFAMGTGTRGSVSTTAELFELADVGGSSTAERSALDKDGDVQACTSSDPRAPNPPADCQAILRVELQALTSAPQPAPEPQIEVEPIGCPQGFVGAAGKCTPAGGAEAHECDPADHAGCIEQCERGDARSCFHAGKLDARMGEPDTRLRSSCDMGFPEACSLMSARLEETWRGCANWQRDQGCEDPSEAEKQRLAQVARAYADQGCDGGDPDGCYFLGVRLLRDGIYGQDVAAGRATLKRAVALGQPMAAEALGWSLYDDDPAGAVAMLEADCERGNGSACALAGSWLTQCAGGASAPMNPAQLEACGKFPAPDAERGERALARACATGRGLTCG